MRVFTATDACGNTATASQVVTVRDRVAPVLATIPTARTIECGEAEPTAMPTASDACDSNPTVSVAGPTVAGACAGETVVTRVFTATDACGNTATAAQVITVGDPSAPVLADVPAAATIECGEAEPTDLPTASDVCDSNPTVSVREHERRRRLRRGDRRDAGVHRDRRVRQHVYREPGHHHRGRVRQS